MSFKCSNTSLFPAFCFLNRFLITVNSCQLISCQCWVFNQPNRILYHSVAVKVPDLTGTGNSVIFLCRDAMTVTCRYQCFHLSSVDAHIMFLWNSGIYIPAHMASQTRRITLSSSPLWEPQISGSQYCS